MKKNSLLLIVYIMALAFSANAQDKALKSFLSYTSYDVPGMIPYIENALAFDCNSVVYHEFEPGQFKATVEVTTIFKQHDTVTNFSKIALDSPVVSDTSKLDGAFINQQRFYLPNGEYVMEISVMDLYNKTQMPYKSEQTVTIKYDGMPSVSDVLLIDSYSKATTKSDFTKSGYDLVPRVYSFYPSSVSKMIFYVELYHSNKLYTEGEYLVNYFIQSYETGSKLKNFNVMKREKVDNVNVLLNSIDIQNLPSGNYYLVVEMRDRGNNLVASNSVFFQRSNPNCQFTALDLSSIAVDNTFSGKLNDLDTIREYLRCLDPICSEVERDYLTSLLKTTDLKTMQQFMYNFWASRSRTNPEDGWLNYLAQVKRVNMSFSTKTNKGYKSDRGNIYLKYGTPDKIVEVPNEPGAYPYEIWHYYQLPNNQRNKRFVFMSKDSSTNDYHLIHSDAIGEVNNYRWQLEIYSRNYGADYNATIDQTENPGAFGTRAGDLYDNPR